MRRGVERKPKVKKTHQSFITVETKLGVVDAMIYASAKLGRERY